MNKLFFIQYRLILIVFLLIYPTGSCINSSNQMHKKEFTISTSHNIKYSTSIQYIEHDPIRIIGTASFRETAKAENWRGNGSSVDPYVIERLSITNSGNLISIHDTDVHFQIKNCFFTGFYQSSPGYGILFSNVSNGYIFNNIIENINGIGILVALSFNNSFIDNSIQRNSGEGIWIVESRNIDILENRIVENGLVGIDLYKSNNINITLNQVRGNKQFGIRLRYSNDNLLFRISIFNNTDYGIQLDNSNFNHIAWNIFIKNKLGYSSQAYDNGIENAFKDNFWFDWIQPDDNNDGIVDSPYEIDGLSHNQDIFPHASILRTIYMINTINDNDINNNNLLFRPNTNIVFGVCLLVIIISLIGILIMKQKN